MPPGEPDDMKTDARQHQSNLAIFGSMTGICVLTAFAMAFASISWAGDNEADEDIEEQKKKRDWTVVPIPVSTPTFGTGLILGGAYFWPQTEEQKKSQPASVTGAVGFYSDNKSGAFAVAHQAYLSEDKWRITAVAAAVDLNLELLVAVPGGSRSSIDWFIEGGGFFGAVSRRIKGNWRAGLDARYIDVEQEFEFGLPNVDFDFANESRSAALGANVEYDTRDEPSNSYTGNRFKFSILASSKSLGGDYSYEAYTIFYASYHSITPKVVLAWEAQACHRSDGTPLWDACIIDLRGFSAIDYFGRSSASAQAEARWRFYGKWGAVVFAGGGYYKNSFNRIRDDELIPSYGIGLRYMVLESQRINVRLDYGRSRDSDALYLGVTENF
jgi:hypothetical protein